MGPGLKELLRALSEVLVAQGALYSSSPLDATASKAKQHVRETSGTDPAGVSEPEAKHSVESAVGGDIMSEMGVVCYDLASGETVASDGCTLTPLTIPSRYMVILVLPSARGDAHELALQAIDGASGIIANSEEELVSDSVVNAPGGAPQAPRHAEEAQGRSEET